MFHAVVAQISEASMSSSAKRQSDPAVRLRDSKNTLLCRVNDERTNEQNHQPIGPMRVKEITLKLIRVRMVPLFLLKQKKRI